METYIIRIYRRDKKTDRLFVGVVEEAGASRKRGFTSFDELRDILEDPGKPRVDARDAGRVPGGGGGGGVTPRTRHRS